MIIKLAPSTVLSDPEHRYALAAKKLYPDTSILDVGGYNDRRRLIASVIGDDFKYKAVNNSTAWYGDQVKAEYYDGNHLPFENQQFDVAISIDTLEHIDPKHRATFIAEMIRVSKKVVLVAPFRDPPKLTLEPVFARISELLRVAVKPSLKEHIEKGLPALDEIRSYFRGQDYSMEFGTDYVKFWQMIFLQLAANAIGRQRSKKVNEILRKIFEERLNTNAPLNKSNAYRVIIST